MPNLRLRRIIDPINRKALIIPIDHGVTMGPVEGIKNIRQIVAEIIECDNCTLVLHKGCIYNCQDILATKKNISVLLHLSASTDLNPHSNHKVLVSSIEEGLRLGADGISMHVNLGEDYETEMLNDLGIVSDECHKWGMPLLVMIYVRGENITLTPDKVTHAARVAMELGADIVKVNYFDKESFKTLTDSVNIPVVIAGGEKRNDEKSLMEDIKDALNAGAAGVSIGRNVFQSQDCKTLIKKIQETIS